MPKGRNKLFEITKEYRFANYVMISLFVLVVLAPFFITIPGVDSSYFSLTWKSPSCFVRETTGKLCPSCGLTRSVVSLYHGDWHGSYASHPVGYIFVVIVMTQLFLRVIPFTCKANWVPWFDMGQLILSGILVNRLL